MNVGPIEIVIVLVLALLVFGPKNLPQMGKTLGKGVREFKHAASAARTELGLDDVAAEISSVKSSVDDLKSSVDLKSTIEAPVKPAAAPAEAAGAAVVAGAATLADAPPEAIAGAPPPIPPDVPVIQPPAPESPASPVVDAGAGI